MEANISAEALTLPHQPESAEGSKTPELTTAQLLRICRENLVGLSNSIFTDTDSRIEAAEAAHEYLASPNRKFIIMDKAAKLVLAGKTQVEEPNIYKDMIDKLIPHYQNLSPQELQQRIVLAGIGLRHENLLRAILDYGLRSNAHSSQDIKTSTYFQEEELDLDQTDALGNRAQKAAIDLVTYAKDSLGLANSQAIRFMQSVFDQYIDTPLNPDIKNTRGLFTWLSYEYIGSLEAGILGELGAKLYFEQYFPEFDRVQITATEADRQQVDVQLYKSPPPRLAAIAQVKAGNSAEVECSRVTLDSTKPPGINTRLVAFIRQRINTTTKGPVRDRLQTALTRFQHQLEEVVPQGIAGFWVTAPGNYAQAADFWQNRGL